MKETKIIVEIVNNKPNYDKVKHLEFIENIVKRMAENSLNMKKFCATIFMALTLFGLKGEVLNNARFTIFGISIFIVIIFSVLDAYYLSLERAFRETYKEINNGMYTDYTIKIKGYSIKNAMKSFSVWGFYLVFIGILGIIYFLVLGKGE